MARMHSLRARMRAFHIWQELGYYPWARSKSARKKAEGRFYKGAFDSIPFLNDDAKRTFVHLLFRPGYMIRDYIRGAHEHYLSPLTSLLVFFSFFALVAALLKPLEEGKDKARNPFDRVTVEDVSGEVLDRNLVQESIHLMRTGYQYLHLDTHPELVTTRQEAALATLEGTLRSQGFTLFLGKFFLLWFALAIALRKYRLRMSAWAAVAAYYLCQTSFFMLFYVIFTWGQSTSVDLVIFLAIMMLDLHQLLGIRWKKCFGRSIAIGFHYLMLEVLVVLLASLVAVGVAYLRVA